MWWNVTIEHRRTDPGGEEIQGRQLFVVEAPLARDARTEALIEAQSIGATRARRGARIQADSVRVEPRACT
ncbi:hypothetical protein ACFV4P_34395 [Kitasatospora sp. NPDC059795]|uniref:hypothetical protein n=1 Tax=Kitasatospora sp. NPDC059795 TaxID=3346949 RepID=UPI0036587B2C